MSIGKYVTNASVIGSLIGAIGTAKQTTSMPKDWRRALVWGVWAAGLALAIAGVARREADDAFLAEQEEHAYLARLEAKAAKKAAKQAR